MRFGHRSPVALASRLFRLTTAPATEPHWEIHSLQVLLISADNPLAELFTLVALLLEVIDDALDVVTQFCRGDLVSANLAAEVGIEPQRTTEVNLETLDTVALVVGDNLPLESDVGNLRAGAGIRAAIERNGDWDVEVTEAFLQVAHQINCALARGDKCELAEL